MVSGWGPIITSEVILMNKPILNCPTNYKDRTRIGHQYIKNKYVLMSFAKCTNKRDVRRLKDFFSGMTWRMHETSGNGYYFEYKDLSLWAAIDVKIMYKMIAKTTNYSGLCAQIGECF